MGGDFDCNSYSTLLVLTTHLFCSYTQRIADPKKMAFASVHGKCKIATLVWYMSYKRICYSPFVHCFHWGVFRSWMLVICSSISSLNTTVTSFPLLNKAPLSLRAEHALNRTQRAEMKFRMNSMTFTNDFDRVPESPLTHGRQQVIQQLIRTGCRLHLPIAICRVEFLRLRLPT